MSADECPAQFTCSGSAQSPGTCREPPLALFTDELVEQLANPGGPWPRFLSAQARRALIGMTR